MINIQKLKQIFSFFNKYVTDGSITACHPPANDNKLIEFKALLLVAQNLKNNEQIEAFQSLLAKCDGTPAPKDFIEGSRCYIFANLLRDFIEHLETQNVGGDHQALLQRKQVT